MATYNNIKKIKIGDNIFNLYDSGNSGGTITSVKTTAGAHTAINVTSGAANFNVPTKTSHLTNDSGFITNYTDEKLTVTVDDSNAYYPILSTSSSAASTKYYSNLLYFQNYGDLKALSIGGTTSNSVKTGGALRLYNAAGGSVTLSFDSAPTYHRAIIIPNQAGENVTLATLNDIPTVSYPVTSVNSKTGAVSLTASDVGALASNTTYVSKITTTAGAHTAISNKSGAVSFNVPTKTSHLTNDSGFTTNTGTVTKVTAGTGLSIGTTSGGNFTTSGTINHTNSVTAQTTQALYPIKIDAQGHISAYGSAVTSLPASDVSDWAKATTKPTYTPSEIGAADASDIPTVSTISVNTTTSKGTYVGSSCHKYGRVVTLTFRFRNTSSIASGADLYTGTLSSTLPLPYDTVSSVTYYGAHALVGVLLTDRSLTIRNASNSAVQFGSSNTASMSFTYVCQ